jgi:Na+/H+-dicarboxylate symporter
VAWADAVVKPLGDLFLSLLFMVVVPIVFSSLFLGVAGLGSVQKLGSLGGRTLLWFLATTTAGGAARHRCSCQRDRAGQGGVAGGHRGSRSRRSTSATRRRASSRAQAKGWIEMLVDIVPRNVVGAAADNGKVLGLIFFALILGAAAIRTAPERTRRCANCSRASTSCACACSAG